MTAWTRFALGAGAFVMATACAHRLALSDRAHWITLTRQQSKRDWGYNIFLDTLSARQRGAQRFEVWTVHEYDTAMVDTAGARFPTEAFRYQLDCVTLGMRPLEVVRYDTSKARVVSRNTNPQTPAGPGKEFVPPRGSVARAVARHTCAALRHDPWRFSYDDE